MCFPISTKIVHTLEGKARPFFSKEHKKTHKQWTRQGKARRTGWPGQTTKHPHAREKKNKSTKPRARAATVRFSSCVVAARRPVRPGRYTTWWTASTLRPRMVEVFEAGVGSVSFVREVVLQPGLSFPTGLYSCGVLAMSVALPPRSAPVGVHGSRPPCVGICCCRLFVA